MQLCGESGSVNASGPSLQVSVAAAQPEPVCLPFCSSQEVITSSEERRAERAQRKGAEDFDEEEAEALEVSVAQDLHGMASPTL